MSKKIKITEEQLKFIVENKGVNEQISMISDKSLKMDQQEEEEVDENVDEIEESPSTTTELPEEEKEDEVEENVELNETIRKIKADFKRFL